MTVAANTNPRNNNNSNMSNMNAKFRPMSFDEIALMPDDELNRRVTSLNGFIDRERRRGNRHENLEIEHSYLSREMIIRGDRKIAHANWLESQGGNAYDTDVDGYNATFFEKY